MAFITASGLAKILIVALGGTPIATALGLKVPVETFAYDTDAAVLYVMQLIAGTKSWAVVGGVGSGWSKYVVSSQATPVALYTTIQDALDAATADNHDTTNPADILLLPGTYDLDGKELVIGSGFAVKALSQTPGDEFDFAEVPAPVVIHGDVVLETTDDGGAALVGVQVRGTLTYRGSGDGGAVLQDVFVFASGEDAVVSSNRTTARGLTARGCKFEVDFGTTGRAFVGGAGTASFFHETSLLSAAVAVRVEGDGVAGGTVVCTGGSILGDVETVAAVGHQNFVACTGVTFTGQMRAGVGTLQVWYLTKLSGNTGPLTVGTGQVFNTEAVLDAQFAGTGTPGTTEVGPTTLVSTVFSPRDWTLQHIAADGTAVSHDVDYITVTLLNGQGFTLPATATFPDGRPIRVKLTTGAGVTVNATPDAADKIDFGVVGAAQAIAPDAARGASRTYVCDRASLTWWTF